jgi:hypothetical protein
MSEGWFALGGVLTGGVLAGLRARTYATGRVSGANINDRQFDETVSRMAHC